MLEKDEPNTLTSKVATQIYRGALQPSSEPGMTTNKQTKKIVNLNVASVLSGISFERKQTKPGGSRRLSQGLCTKPLCMFGAKCAECVALND